MQLQFASYAAGLQNTTTYLQENAMDYWWQSLPPYSFRGGYALVWLVYGNDGGFDSNYVDRAGTVHPLIFLITSTTISGGFGTSEDPYVVN